ncbi:hypothetical protein H7X87_00420 [Acetobacteraceae bacterium]|nr:hypothetical protein [Candidatus Parcubacteria bacterium]
MKKKLKDLSDKQRLETLDALYTAAASIRGRASMKLFLRDLLTPSERIMLGRRILIARELMTGKTYDDIAVRMQVGHDTVRRVHRWLEDQLPGYEQAIKEMEEEFKRRRNVYEDKKLYATSMLYRLKKKYPGHFALFPTPKLKK